MQSIVFSLNLDHTISGHDLLSKRDMRVDIAYRDSVLESHPDKNRIDCSRPSLDGIPLSTPNSHESTLLGG